LNAGGDTVDRLRALVVENRDLVATRLKAHLRGLGHDVVGVARDGREAISSAQQIRPDIIFINNRLPNLDGIDAARAIVTVRPVAIVLLADYAGAGLVRRAQEAGVVAHFRPSDERQLRNAIAVALARFRELELLRGEAEDLGEALAARKVVDQAKDVLILRARLSEAQAFDHLHEHSQRERTSLGRVAGAIVGAEEIISRKSPLAFCLQRLLDVVACEFVPGSGQAPGAGAAGSPHSNRLSGPEVVEEEAAPALATA
jgi:AmiR/NasT family two-component response regulator